MISAREQRSELQWAHSFFIVAYTSRAKLCLTSQLCSVCVPDGHFYTFTILIIISLLMKNKCIYVSVMI